MKIRVLLAILTFCAGAAFTLVDIGTDFALAFEYWSNSKILHPEYRNYADTTNDLQPHHNSVFAVLTTTWIGLGGVAQVIIVLYFSIRHDDRLEILPKWVRNAFLNWTAFLLGPVLVDAFGAYYVFQNASDERIQDIIERYNNKYRKRDIDASGLR